MQDNSFDALKEWGGMPEFYMEDLTPSRKLVISFRNQEDVDRFSKIIGQNITPNQKSLWFPPMPKRQFSDKRYVDGDSAPEALDLTPFLKGGFFTDEP